MLFHYQIRNYFIYSKHVDMRKGIDALVAAVNNELNKDPLSGDLFVFINRKRNQIKMLHWQDDGFAVFYKRLESGTYEVPSLTHSSSTVSLTADQLIFILQGVSLKSVKKRTRYSLSFV